MNTKLPARPLNVDDNEIAKFAALADRWWDMNGEFKPLHLINPVRLEYIASRAEGLFGKKVLDVGCGGGILSESMARSGADVTGLDMAQEPLEVARLHAQEANLKINYVRETIEEHAANYPDSYDIVTCMELLEHVPDPYSIVTSCAKLVKPGGQVFFSTINRNGKAWLMAIIGAEYLLRLVPRGTHELRKFIRPAELLNWANESGLTECHITGLHYNPFSGRFFLGRNVDVNYLLHMRRDDN